MRKDETKVIWFLFGNKYFLCDSKEDFILYLSLNVYYFFYFILK